VSDGVAGAAPTVRSATAPDLAAVQLLLTQLELPSAGVQAIFALDANDFVVATAPSNDREVIAVGGLEVCGRHALLRSLAVHPSWQGHGLGASIVTRLMAQAESRGLDALYLLTTTAEGYFPRFGFSHVPRVEVPIAIAQTPEFAGVCPSSATAMTKRLAQR
jgi:amino-acid N-acetyltransferase